MRALFRLKGFSFPNVECHTSIQQTFVSHMQRLAAPGSVLGYAAHRWVKRYRKPLWRIFKGAALSFVGGLGLMGVGVLAQFLALAHIGAWLFALSILPLFGVVMAVGYSLNVMPEALNAATRNRFLSVGAEVARKDRAVRPMLKKFGEQLKHGFPNQWWESVCVALEEYNRALDQRTQYEQRVHHDEQLERVFVQSVDDGVQSQSSTEHIRV